MVTVRDFWTILILFSALNAFSADPLRSAERILNSQAPEQKVEGQEKIDKGLYIQKSQPVQYPFLEEPVLIHTDTRKKNVSAPPRVADPIVIMEKIKPVIVKKAPEKSLVTEPEYKIESPKAIVSVEPTKAVKVEKMAPSMKAQKVEKVVVHPQIAEQAKKVVRAAPVIAKKIVKPAVVAPVMRKIVPPAVTAAVTRKIASVQKCGYVPSQADEKFDTRTIKKDVLIARAPVVYDKLLENLSLDAERRKISWPVKEPLSLQEISQKIFGTTQRWRELYILNYKNLKTYDNVPLGTELTAFEFVHPPCTQ